MKEKDEFLKIFPTGIRKILARMKVGFHEIQEIRMRVNRPLIVYRQGREYFVSEWGLLLKTERDGYLVSKEELMETMEYLSGYSLYAFEERAKAGISHHSGRT